MTLPADNYIISRDASEAERLDLQHRCTISCQGYYIHPDVPVSSKARLADLATGTAIWLREFTSTNPEAELHGFDISDKMFSELGYLAANMQLHLADIKEPFESHWLGYFDPGGWLQWYEDDRPIAVRHAFRPAALLGVVEKKTPNGQDQWRPSQIRNLARFNRFIMPNDRAEAMNYGYMNLDVLMADPDIGNLEQVGCDGFIIDRADDGGELRRDWALMGISACRSMIKAREDHGAKIADIGHDEWADRAMEEIESGAHFVSRATVFTGRKKL